MRGRIPTVFIAAIAALVGSILLPLAINIVTGSTPPPILKPFARYSWPIIGFSAIVIVVAVIRQVAVPKSPPKPSVSIHPRNRINALAQIQRQINGRLDKSLTRIARITLSLESSVTSIVKPEHLMVQPVSGSVDEDAPQSDISQTFTTVDESLLILGAPGSGKTTLLLELAQHLHDLASADLDAGLPVIVDLARWAAKLPPPLAPPKSSGEHTGQAGATDRPPTPLRRMIASRRQGAMAVSSGQEVDLHEWLLKELRDLYRIPHSISENWLQNRKLIFLLDGLDEMPPSARDQCVVAINKFQSTYSLPSVAITCRVADYEGIRTKLALQGAVMIKPLTRDQIESYLDAAADRLSGIRAALRRDSTLWDLVDSPLMINVMVLAYHDRPVGEVALGDTLAQRRRRLIEAYVTEVTSRRQAPTAKYTILQTTRWLAQIAYCAAYPHNAMPLRRTWRGWRMTWDRTAPESQVRLLLSASFPWVVGISCSVGIIIPLLLRVSAAAAASSAVPLSIFQFSFILATNPIHRRKPKRAPSYTKMRLRGLICGVALGGIELAVVRVFLPDVALSSFVARMLVAGSAVILLLAIAGWLESRVPPALIEPTYWVAIIGGIGFLILCYHWKPNAAELSYFWVVGTVVIGLFSILIWLVFLVTDIPDESRVVQHHLDWRALEVPTLLMLAAFALGTFISPAKPSMAIVTALIGVVSGAIWGICLGSVVALALDVMFSPLRVFLASLDLLPFFLGRFVVYSVDRSLLYREKSGYSFIHAIFQEYFLRRHPGWPKLSALDAFSCAQQNGR